MAQYYPRGKTENESYHHEPTGLVMKVSLSVPGEEVMCHIFSIEPFVSNRDLGDEVIAVIGKVGEKSHR